MGESLCKEPKVARKALMKYAKQQIVSGPKRTKSGPSPLCADDWVQVRSREEILATLDENGQLDGMPFMPEMLASAEGPCACSSARTRPATPSVTPARASLNARFT